MPEFKPTYTGANQCPKCGYFHWDWEACNGKPISTVESWQRGGHDDPTLTVQRQAQILREIEEMLTDIEKTPDYPANLPGVLEQVLANLKEARHDDTEP